MIKFLHNSLVFVLLCDTVAQDFSLSLTVITHVITVNLDETASVHLNISTSDTVTVTAYKSNNLANIIKQELVTRSQTEVTFNIGPIGDSDRGNYTFIAKPDPSNAYDQRVEVEIKIKDPARVLKTDDGYLLESFLTAVKNQSTAKHNCNKRNGWLIKDNTMQNYVENLVSGYMWGGNKDFFIGLEYDSKLGWHWADGTILNYTNWGGYEGGISNSQNCACIFSNTGKWADVKCSQVIRRYVCQSVLLTIKATETEVVVIRGKSTSITLKINSQDDPVNIEVYKLPDGTSIVHSEPDVESTYTYTTEPIDNFQNVTYKFVATPTTKTYTIETLVDIYVHFPVNITELYPVEISTPVTTGPSYVTCEATGSPPAKSKWFRDEMEVSINKNSTIYQRKSVGKSLLFIENAVLSDGGSYTCRGVNFIGDAAQKNEIEQSITLSVYGSPEITKNKVHECSIDGKITIDWKPNNQTVGILHRIEAVSNNNISSNYSQITKANAQESTEIHGLTPYTNYTIQITVCPDECIAKLHATSTVETGGGLPDPVTDARVIQDNTNTKYCTVIWSWSDRTPRSNAIFQITTVSTLVKLSANIEQQTYSNEQSYAGGTLENFQVQIETKPNRNYSFCIKTKTYACESSNTSKADGQCVTDVAAPETVPAPSTLSSTGKLQTQPIKVTVPDESNGPISCIFVLVKSGNKLTNNAITMDHINKASEAARNQSQGNEDYLAIAIQRSKIFGSLIHVSLGDDTSSTCDISSSSAFSRRKRAVTQTISGRNLKLEIGITYSYYAVSSTPSSASGKIFLQRSISTSFYHEYNKDPSLWWIAGLIGGLGALVAVVLVVIYMKKMRRTRKSTDQDDQTLQIEKTDKASVNSHFRTNFVESDESKTLIALEELLSKFEQKNANGGEKFLEEFKNLEQEAVTMFSNRMALKNVIKTENKHNNILPLDLSRAPSNREEETHANACYIHGYSKSKKFIAIQGPLASTVNNFWRLVVEQKSKVIVMLTNCSEAQENKSAKYWPDHGKDLMFGHIKVSCNEEKFFGGYKKRIFTISTGNVPAYQIEQYHFLNWPDHGGPVTTSNYYRFYEACMESHGNEHYPIIVHCSTGAGQTAVFIGYDCLIEEAGSANRVDIYHCVLKMRQQRVDMVQTSDQYKLLHKFLVEYHLFDKSDTDGIGLEEKIQEDKVSAQTSRIKKEFENLDVTASISKIDAKHAENSKITLMWQQGDGNVIPRITANHLKTYDESIRMIACEGPTLSNVEYFWRAGLIVTSPRL
uniref:receptor-type tyrosine-protein phosphatase eta-like n=1 Tax=Styela clava TaxID=7725 RepID=UPI00193927EC|nr:receptor-type tyrosine-protein phosphatase eta-like [Styela clava]